MTLILTVAEVTAPVFLLAAIGFGWVTLGFEYRMEFVARMAMTLSVPCLIFVSLMRTEIPPATPVAVTSYLLAVKYGADAEAVAGLVVVSTLLSVVLLPGLLAVLI